MSFLEHPQPKKLKYNQFGQKDTLTDAEDALILQKVLSKIYKRPIKASEVNRILSQLEHKNRTGYIS